MAILNLVDIVTNALDNNKKALAVFIDLSKAFDTIDHSILLNKLEHYGIRGMSLKLFESYLCNRVQQVSFNSIASSLLNITCGVPQGSILGPVLFLLYINDINKCSMYLNFIMFADDTTIIYVGNDWNDVESVINSELKKLSLWFKVNKLSLNISKTNFVAFTSSKLINSSININIDGTLISQVESTKFLGIEIDNSLSWKIHINKVEQKISCAIGVIRKIRYKISQDTALMLYNTMILPHLQYCNVIWGNNYKNSLMQLYILQKRALKMSTYAPKLTNSIDLFSRCNKLTIFNINKIQMASLMHSVKHRLHPSVVCSLFHITNTIHDHQTRSQFKFHKITASNNARKFCAIVAGPILWDTIPDEVKLLTCSFTFKKHLKLFYLSQQKSGNLL